MRHIHASSRTDNTLDSLYKAVRSQLGLCHILTLTEVGPERRERVLRRLGRELSFGVITGDNSNSDDCAIMYAKERYRVVYTEQFKASNRVVYTAKGNPWGLPYSTIAVLEDLSNGKRVVLAVAHFAASVEGALATNQKNHGRALQWRDAVTRTKNRVNRLSKRYKADARIIAADWNINFRKTWARQLLKAIAPMYKNAWKKYPNRGTHRGGRVIDAVFYRGRISTVGTKIMKANGSSDHVPIRTIFEWK